MGTNDIELVEKLAAIIRAADGGHTMGASALADAIADSGFLYELEKRGFDRGVEWGQTGTW